MNIIRSLFVFLILVLQSSCSKIKDPPTALDAGGQKNSSKPGIGPKKTTKELNSDATILKVNPPVIASKRKEDDKKSIIVVFGEKIPKQWFDDASDFVKKQINSNSLMWHSIQGKTVLGIVNENGVFITWPGAREIKSLDSGSEVFLFYNPDADLTGEPSIEVSF